MQFRPLIDYYNSSTVTLRCNKKMAQIIGKTVSSLSPLIVLRTFLFWRWGGERGNYPDFYNLDLFFSLVIGNFLGGSYIYMLTSNIYLVIIELFGLHGQRPNLTPFYEVILIIFV